MGINQRKNLHFFYQKTLCTVYIAIFERIIHSFSDVGPNANVVLKNISDTFFFDGHIYQTRCSESNALSEVVAEVLKYTEILFRRD